jgi:hypothetical protein
MATEYKPIENIYADLVIAGKKTIDEVPAVNRDNVKAIILERKTQQ